MLHSERPEDLVVELVESSHELGVNLHPESRFGF